MKLQSNQVEHSDPAVEKQMAIDKLIAIRGRLQLGEVVPDCEFSDIAVLFTVAYINYLQTSLSLSSEEKAYFDDMHDKLDDQFNKLSDEMELEPPARIRITIERNGGIINEQATI